MQRILLNPLQGTLIHFESCHHPRWVSNIQRSQCCRLRRNCTRDMDYNNHGQLLSQKFLNKGYPASLVEEAFDKYRTLPTRPRTPPPSVAKQPTRFITQLHAKYQKIERIFSAHVGMYQCKKALWKTCEFVHHGQKTFTVKGKTHTFKEFYNFSISFSFFLAEPLWSHPHIHT